ncbi:MAG: hypothetical protein R3C59_02990 [Planctomycetaceae bacterium]
MLNVVPLTAQLIRRFLGIPVRQQRATGVLFAYSFLTSASYVAARTIGDSLFLSQQGVSRLPQMFLLSSLAVAATAMIANRLGRSTQMLRVAQVTRLLLMSVTLLFAWLDGIALAKFLVVSVLYILAEVRGCLNTIQMTSILSEVFRNGRRKSVYAVIGAGAPLAGFSAGLLMGLEAADVGGRTWLLFICVLDLLAVFVLKAWQPDQSLIKTETAIPESERPQPTVVAQSSTDQPDNSAEGVEMSESAESADPLLYSYLLPLVALVATKVVVLTLINYQWKVLAADHFHNDEQQLTLYFAEYYAIANVFILLFQLFLTGRFLERTGTVVSLILFPVLAGLTGLGLLQNWLRLSPITAVTLARATDIYRRAVHDTSLAVIYSPLSILRQRRFIAIINGLVKPGAEATASVLLTLVASLVATLEITIVWMSLLPVWLGSVFVLGRQYRRLRVHGLDQESERQRLTRLRQAAVASIESPHPRKS